MLRDIVNVLAGKGIGVGGWVVGVGGWFGWMDGWMGGWMDGCRRNDGATAFRDCGSVVWDLVVVGVVVVS